MVFRKFIRFVSWALPVATLLFCVSFSTCFAEKSSSAGSSQSINVDSSQGGFVKGANAEAKAPLMSEAERNTLYTKGLLLIGGVVGLAVLLFVWKTGGRKPSISLEEAHAAYDGVEMEKSGPLAASTQNNNEAPVDHDDKSENAGVKTDSEFT